MLSNCFRIFSSVVKWNLSANQNDVRCFLKFWAVFFFHHVIFNKIKRNYIRIVNILIIYVLYVVVIWSIMFSKQFFSKLFSKTLTWKSQKLKNCLSVRFHCPSEVNQIENYVSFSKSSGITWFRWYCSFVSVVHCVWHFLDVTQGRGITPVLFGTWFLIKILIFTRTIFWKSPWNMSLYDSVKKDYSWLDWTSIIFFELHFCR